MASRLNHSQETASRPAPGSPTHRAATILVAEDHIDSQDALRALLEAFGYHVTVAGNGRQAVKLALEQAPDLILMDIMMPELDGIEAMRALRLNPATSRTPIIVVTAVDGARQQALQAGANDIVPKPIDIRRLVAKVDTLLQPPLA